MGFIYLSKKEIRQRRLVTMKIVRILDDVDWVYGSKTRVKRHERCEWAQKALTDGTLVSFEIARIPEWLAKRIEALPPNCNATLQFNLCEYPEEGLFKTTPVDGQDYEITFGDSKSPKVSFVDICKEFGQRKHGTTFSDLVRYYIKNRFNNTQARAAEAAQLDPQVVNQIYNAAQKSRMDGKIGGVARRTVIALGLAFELTLDEADEFMRSAGYAFSDSDEDLLFKLCFKRRFYKISEINAILQSIQKNELGSRDRPIRKR